MPLVDSLERAILDHLFGDPTYVPPSNWYVGLSSTTPTRTGTNFTEPAIGTNGYARVLTAATDWAAAANATPATKANGNAIAFPQATGGSWLAGVNLTWFGLFLAASGGTAQMLGQLTVAKPVLQDDTADFPVGTLIVKLGAPGDTF
jgi:hypothetical protein